MPALLMAVSWSLEQCLENKYSRMNNEDEAKKSEDWGVIIAAGGGWSVLSQAEIHEPTRHDYPHPPYLQSLVNVRLGNVKYNV